LKSFGIIVLSFDNVFRQSKCFFSELHFNINYRIYIYTNFQINSNEKIENQEKNDYKQTSNILNKRSEKIVVNDSI